MRCSGSFGMSQPAIQSVRDLPLTKECNHWTEISQVPWDLQKYWQQRYTIFPYYDDGFHLTHDAWFGVTPEPVAIKIATEMASTTPPHKRIIIDAFAGVGNNSIAFASAAEPGDPDKFRWDRVIAIERDTATLACAQHNASLYGPEVADRITWINGDSFEYLALLRRSSSSSSGGGTCREGPEGADSSSGHSNSLLSEDLAVDVASTVIFASPPWGGPGYSTDEVFDLSGMEPYNLAQLHEAYKIMDHALYLPRTSDLRQIAQLAPTTSADDVSEDGVRKKVDVAQYCVHGASKALVAYIPASPAAAPDGSI
ncbi:RNA cap guanine-N2 methyltransferase-domain-containing protein [Microdochium trichocladiopsis]|uniref:Trimethylguanosine synthase n=1 Tax=Microdochium trichocladiopsis TaxID=1682393 RepID=A0A9P8YDL4_9PEZI|nr:RNA cap guanine-N2 methyltransferase-domain-containing protein [Microdochium trichocladiopsis]KAH7034947.1 RNA cap guanine-N2 methyltransferase-domain-containing protein [Microdochium trichocladiopsis]